MAYYIRDNKNNAQVSGSFSMKSTALRSLETNFSRKTHHVYHTNWRVREIDRENHIDLHPFGLNPQHDHYLHVSANQDATSTKLLVAYTQNDAKGGQDIQTPIKVGAYLKKFYPALTSDQITDLSGRLAAKFLLANGLKFAVTRAEIRDVYERCYGVDGVHSCMAGPVTRFNNRNQIYNVHPAEAYAGPDLQLAYLEKNGTIIARALCWPEKKVYGRVYGDSSRFADLMSAQDYEDGGHNALDGARMSKIVIESDDYYGDRVVSPYIDGPNCVHESEDGEYLVIGRDPEDGDHRYDAHLDGNFTMTMYSSHLNRNIRGSRRTMTRVLDPLYGERYWIGKTEVEAATREFEGQRYFNTQNFERYWVEVGEGETLKTIPVCIRSRNYVQTSDGVYHHPSEVRSTGRGYVTMKQYFTEYRTCEMTNRIDRMANMIQMEHGSWWSTQAFDQFGLTVDGKHYAKWVAPAPQPNVAMAA